MNPNVDEIVRKFVEDVRQIYGDSLLAIILYGSAASGEYVKGKSNINCLVLLKRVTMAELKRSTKYVRKWRKNGIVAPLFLDPAYTRSSADVFPIEFLDMKERYCLLYGQDFLRDLDVSLRNLRFQCEQELKGKLLRLRQLYLERADSIEALKSLMIKSLSSFTVLFKALLRLKGVAALNSTDEILAQLSALGLPTEAATRILSLKRKDIKARQDELDTLFDQYLAEIQAAVDYVDRAVVE